MKTRFLFALEWSLLGCRWPCLAQPLKGLQSNEIKWAKLTLTLLASQPLQLLDDSRIALFDIHLRRTCAAHHR
jgi:hypothetical protein